MSILRSMYTGVSGLRSNGTMISTVGDNIANVNTVGYKGSRVNFADVLGQSIIGVAGALDQTGNGSAVGNIQQILTQGSISRTGYETDMAISGNGYFVVSGSHDGREGRYYTRAGQFSLNSEGYLVNPQGLRVQGYDIDPTGTVHGSLGDINLSGTTSDPLPTSSIEISANFDSQAQQDPGGASFDILDPANTSNFNTTITVYDTVGTPHEVDVYFRRTAIGWEYHGLVDAGELSGGIPGTNEEILGGELTFDLEGRLDSEVQTLDNFNPIGTVNPQLLTVDFGDSITTDGGTGTGSTAYAADSSINSQNQDGYATGTLQFISVEPDGSIMGSFSNGKVRSLSRVGLATFAGDSQLARIGGNLFSETVGSGQAVVGSAGEGGRGAILGASLEMSNVDLAEEFVNLISAQRAFQANSKTINTADQLLSEIIALKR